MAPNNGISSCSDRTTTSGGTCTITCNDGFMITGNSMGTCGGDGTWSGDNATCVMGKYCSHLVK